MKKVSIAIMSLAVLGLVSCKDEVKEKEVTEEVVVEEVTKNSTEKVVAKDKKLSFALYPKSDSEAKGKVVIIEHEGKVYFTAEIEGLSEGTHAIHLHEKADCSSDDGKSTGGHWNPTFTSHGKWGSEDGYHLGDIGNFEADARGNGVIDFTTDQWCIGCGDEKKDIVGKAVIVHQGVDDFVSQPSGAAGARISCAAIIQ